MPNLKDCLPEIQNLEPLEDHILWRYTDIPSLIEILTNEYLPLVKVSCLRDQAEGAILKSALGKLPKARDVGKDFLFQVYKNTTFASCWCENEEERASMWERFSPKDGVAIKTNAKRLLEWLTPRPEFKIRYVKYINENPDDILSGLAEIDFEEFEELQQDLFFYKMSDFTDEREVRILNCIRLNNFSMIVSELKASNHYEVKRIMDTHVVPSEDILQAKIRSMNELITEIVISPSARDGIYKIVKELVKSLNKLRKNDGKTEFTFKVEKSRRTQWF